MPSINSVRPLEIPREEWKSLLDRFTEAHCGWKVTIETYDRKTDEHVTSPEAALRSVVFDLEDSKNSRINVTVLLGNKEIRHILFQPWQLILRTSKQTGDEALIIESLNLETTIRLRRPPQSRVLPFKPTRESARSR